MWRWSASQVFHSQGWNEVQTIVMFAFIRETSGKDVFSSLWSFFFLLQDLTGDYLWTDSKYLPRISQVLQLCCLQTSNSDMKRWRKKRLTTCHCVCLMAEDKRGWNIDMSLTFFVNIQHGWMFIALSFIWGTVCVCLRKFKLLQFKDFGLYQIQMDILLVLDAPVSSITWKQFDFVHFMMWIVMILWISMIL